MVFKLLTLLSWTYEKYGTLSVHIHGLNVLVPSVLYSTMFDFIWLLYFFLRPRILNLFGGLSDAVRVSTSLPRQLTPSSRNEFVTMTSKKSLTSKMTCTILNRLRRSKKFCMLIRLQMVSQVQRNLNQVQIKQVWLRSAEAKSYWDFYTVGQIYEYVLKHENNALTQTLVCVNVRILHPNIGF